ncbi:NADH:ubiquinone reductase (H(+)-translocating) [Ranunculus cassubicifolius]
MAATRGTPLPCIQMFRDISVGKAKDENCVFSPCSVQLAISLITNGAKGPTLEVLLKFLQAENKNQLKSRASELISALMESSMEGPKLSFVGGIWVDESKKLTQNFKADAETIYKAKAEEVDFKKNAKEMIKTVNQWAAESTNGLIDSLLPENSIDDRTRVVLANALYFKGLWSFPFVKSLTEDFEFYMLGEDSVKVPFMSNYNDTQYIVTFDDLKVLRLPYGKSSFSMYILLPNDRDGLWPLVEKVGSDPSLLDQYASAEKMDLVPVGRFRVPKFKINYKLEASEVLKDMGLELCFSKEKAEFNEMVVGGRIKLHAVHHGSRIEVDEEGTEAAASTEIEMDFEVGCSKFDDEEPPMVRVNFVADHPFMYVVKDDNSGIVMFIGHVVNPLLA